MMLRPHPKNFPKGEKKGNFLTWPGIKNLKLLNHIPPSIATALENLDKERKNFQLKKQVKPEL